VADRCPMELSKDAIWLWHSDFSASRDEPEIEPSVEDLLEDVVEETRELS